MTTLELYKKIDDNAAIYGITLEQAARLEYVSVRSMRNLDEHYDEAVYSFLEDFEKGYVDDTYLKEFIQEVTDAPDEWSNPQATIQKGIDTYNKYVTFCKYYSAVRNKSVEEIIKSIEDFTRYALAQDWDSAKDGSWNDKTARIIKPTAQKKITRYAIIDHVGSLTSSENKRIYKEVYTQAKAEDLKAYTLRKVCIADSPYCREVTSKMKYRARYVKNPVKVYIVCDTLDATVESITQIWESRNIPVEIFEANAFVRTHKIDVDGQYDRKRRIAETWAPAIGWSFSAPVTRIQTLNNIENFSKRPDHDALVASGETHFTKPFTNAETFLEMNCCVATDKEVDDFYTHLRYLWDNKLIADCLEPDYRICKCCGRPRNIRNHKDQFGKEHLNSICQFCDAEFDDEDIVGGTYYEDSFEDSEE